MISTSGHKHGPDGFTLVEIMIVVAVIGLLAILAIPSLAKARERSITIKCMEHLRLVDHAVVRYETDYAVTLFPIRNNGVQIRRSLLEAGYINVQNAFDCPTSRIRDYDDIHLLYNGSDYVRPLCTIVPATHVLP